MAIYIASRARIPGRVEKWQALRASGVQLTSTWIDYDPVETDPLVLQSLWVRILEEIKAASGLLFYCEAADMPLKGAFVEAGAAMMAGKPVAVVRPDGVAVGSWVEHPLMRHFTNVDAAVAWLEAFPAGLAPSSAVDVAPGEAGMAGSKPHRPKAFQDIRYECMARVAVDGLGIEFDDAQLKGELCEAALSHLIAVEHGQKTSDVDFPAGDPPIGWPWKDSDWDPTDKRQMMVRAAALLVAEIERLDRADYTSRPLTTP